MLSRVEFQFLKVVDSFLSGDEATVGLIHWDGFRLRTAARSWSDADVSNAVRGILASLKERCAASAAGQSSWLPLSAVAGVDTRVGSSLRWSEVHCGVSRDAQQHFKHIAESLGLDHGEASSSSHRRLPDALADLGTELQASLHERVRVNERVRAHFEYVSPLSWRAQAWQHCVPVDLGGDRPVESRVREALAKAMTGIPESDGKVFVVVAGTDSDAQELARKEGDYLAKAVPHGRLGLAERSGQRWHLDGVRALVQHDLRGAA